MERDASGADGAGHVKHKGGSSRVLRWKERGNFLNIVPGLNALQATV